MHVLPVASVQLLPADLRVQQHQGGGAGRAGWMWAARRACRSQLVSCQPETVRLSGLRVCVQNVLKGRGHAATRAAQTAAPLARPRRQAAAQARGRRLPTLTRTQATAPAASAHVCKRRLHGVGMLQRGLSALKEGKEPCVVQDLDRSSRRWPAADKICIHRVECAWRGRACVRARKGADAPACSTWLAREAPHTAHRQRHPSLQQPSCTHAEEERQHTRRRQTNEFTATNTHNVALLPPIGGAQQSAARMVARG